MQKMTEQDNNINIDIDKHIKDINKKTEHYIKRNKLIDKPKKANKHIKKIKEAV
jgi:hypothetical protein